MKKNNNLNVQKSKAHGYRFTVGRILQLAVALVFLLFVGRLLYISISRTVQGQDLSQRTHLLYQRNQVIKSSRGSIYDRNGLAIAEDTHLFTVYAILDKSSINYKNKPEYVVDKAKTAAKLAQVLPLSAKRIEGYLTPKKKAFQVQFGSAGSNLTVKQKNKIAAFHLPGIKFIETPARLYPNGNFASHVIGIAQPVYNKKNSTPTLEGTMGLEAWFNKTLSGRDGYQISSVDASEHQFPNGNQEYRPAQNGNNLYLTIDSQLQTLMENRLSAVQTAYNPVDLTAVVEDMKTGKILAASQRPTFNPQTKKGMTKSYRDILVQDTYEPGSVFKVLTLSAAINSGRYAPNAYYHSGSVQVGGATIHDWQTSGWGNIPISQAFPRSSNVGFVHIEQRMGSKVWRQYLNRYHIGKLTGVTLPGEQPGMIAFKTSTDRAVTSFGQGVDVNVMQMVQAYSALGNNGQMVKPQFVERITNPDGKTIKGYQIKKVGTPVYNQKTRKAIIANMKRVLNKQIGTGYAYHMPGKDIAVKTGTAQIAAPKGGGYLKGDSNYIFSVVGVTPTKNPRYCLYLTMKQPRRMTQAAETILASMFKPLMNRIIVMAKHENQPAETIKVPKLTGLTVKKAREALIAKGLNLVTAGKGKRIDSQALKAGQQVLSGRDVVVLTTGKLICPNMKGWSSDDLHQFSLLTGVKINTTGNGKVVSQSLAAGTIIKTGKKLEVSLKE